MPEGKPLKVDSLFSLAYSTVFEAVKLVRNEEHWTLTKEEATKLGKVSVACLNTIPEVTKAKFEQRFNRWLPWVSLVGFGVIITYPRVLASMELAKQENSNRFRVIPMPPATEEKGSEDAQAFRNTPDVPRTNIERDNSTNFPPSDRAHFPPLDYKIPS